MGFLIAKRKFLTVLIIFAVFISGPIQGVSQGTSLEIEKAEVVKGEGVNLTVNIIRAADGLGRLDATIESSNPEILRLTSLTPEGISKEFLQIDVLEDERIKFKLVDLRKKINPGDKNIELLTLGVRGIESGKVNLSITEVKYTDEKGNLVEPDLQPTEITVVSSGTEDADKSTRDGKEEKEVKADKDVPEDKSQPPGQPEKDETEARQAAEAGKEDYRPVIEGAKLKLGKTGQTRLKVISLPNGLRMAQIWITNPGGIAFKGVNFLAPKYYQIVEKTDRLVSLRLVDFDDEIQPGTRELKVGDITMEALQPGETSLRVKKLKIWPDEGGEVTRRGDPVSIKVNLGPIGLSTNPPEDLDGDGLFEDINGDGKLSKEDAFILSFNLESKFIRESTSLFDFNWDGKVTFEDAVKLIREMQ